MRKFRLLIGALCLCSAFVLGGCGDDDTKGGEPTPPPVDELENAYAFDGVKTDIRSMFFEKIEDYNYVFLSPDEVETYGELLERDDQEELIHPMIQLTIDPALVGKTVDVKTEMEYFSFFNMTASQDEFESIESEVTEEVASGSFAVTMDAEKKIVSVEFKFTLPSGKVFEGNCSMAYIAPEEPDEPEMPDVEPNIYSIGQTKGALGSVFAFTMYDMIYLAMTPTPGLESFDEVYDQDELIAGLLDPSLIGKEVDMMTERSSFALQVMLDALPGGLDVGNTNTDDLVAGKIFSSLKDGELTVVFAMTMDDGTKVVVSAQADYAEPAGPDYYLKIDDEVKEIKSAFYENTEDDGSWINFTVADLTDVEFPSEVFGDTHYYTKLYLDENLMMGDDQDITKLTKGFEFTYGGYEVADGGQTTQFAQTIKAGDLKGATGTFNVIKSGSTEGKYTVTFDFVLGDGTSVSGVYTGTCLPYRVEKKNEYGFVDATMKAIGSVVIDQTKTPCEIWITAEAGITTAAAAAASSDPVKLTLPANGFDGNPKGFSVVAEASVTYSGVTYNNAAGDSGNVSAAIDGGKAVVTFNVWQDDDMGYTHLYIKGYYAGAVTVVK